MSISNGDPGTIGHPPCLSSCPYVWLALWFRIIACSFGRTLKCKLTSSEGRRAGPVWIFMENLKKGTKKDQRLRKKQLVVFFV